MIEELLNGPIAKYNTITRFQGNSFIGDKESIAQHSFWVAIICDNLFEHLFYSKTNAKMLMLYRIVIKEALLHEMDEAIVSADIVHPLKYHEKHGFELREILDLIAKDLIENKYNCDSFIVNYSENKQKDSAISGEQKIAKFMSKISDWISFVVVCLNQHNLGNKSSLAICIIGAEKCIIVIDDFKKFLLQAGILHNNNALNSVKSELLLICEKYK